MDDGVSGDENLMRAHLQDHRDEGTDQGSGLIISHVMVPAEEGEGGQVKEGKKEAAGKEEEGRDDEEKGSSSGGGGILDHLISTLVAPLSPRASSTNRDNKGESDFQKSTGANEVGNGKDIGEGGKRKLRSSGEESGGGSEGNGIIGNIVSRLPKSLPDDAAPTTDEASILIHSIVRD